MINNFTHAVLLSKDLNLLAHTRSDRHHWYFELSLGLAIWMIISHMVEPALLSHEDLLAQLKAVHNWHLDASQN